MKYIVNLIITSILILGLSKVLPHIQVRDFSDALLFALVVGVLNIFLKPILIVLSLPISFVEDILTLGCIKVVYFL